MRFIERIEPAGTEEAVCIRVAAEDSLYVAEDFLLSFSIPNFYFHVTTAYDILRSRGVVLGKADYLGRTRGKRAQPA